MITWKRQMNSIQRIAVTMVFALAGCEGANTNVPVTSIEPNISIDKMRFRDLNEHTISLDKYKGKTIFINFWATWCKPCIQEMPSIEKMKTILKNEEVVFLMASSESTEEIEAFRNTHNYDFNYARIENIEDLEIPSLPTTYIFNAEGTLVFSESGYRKWNEKVNIDMLLKIVNKDG